MSTTYINSSVQENVIGSDNRALVGNTTVYPYSAVVRVYVDFNGDGLFDSSGSGAMIGPNDVLTAAHVLWDPIDGFADSIMVVPGQAGSAWPFGSAFGQTWTVPSEYISVGGGNSDAAFQYDFGVINLSTNIGNSTGWFGLQSVTSSTVTGSVVRLAGYPGDLSGGLFQYTSSDNVDFVIGNRLFYDGALDTGGGNSGGPLWWELSTGPYIVGVHNAGGDTLQFGELCSRPISSIGSLRGRMINRADQPLLPERMGMIFLSGPPEPTRSALCSE